MNDMLWRQYVFRRRNEVPELWDEMFKDREVRLLYIAGCGFDVRVIRVMEQFLGTLKALGKKPEQAELLLVNVKGYELSDELQTQTIENGNALRTMFSAIGKVSELTIGMTDDDEADLSASQLLQTGTRNVVRRIEGYTDIILDVSSLPRVVYLSLLVGILGKLVPDRNKKDCLFAGGVNFQVLVGEDSRLDGQILSEDPSNEPLMVPGFSGALNLESARDWPLVWFPILGENRSGQLERILLNIPDEDVEVCPVVPHPSKNPRRADCLLLEYRDTLFTKMRVPTSNIMRAHEAHPFETYRQLYSAMERYRRSFELLGGCRLVVTPLSSKLMTLGVGLACFNMRPLPGQEKHALAIPYAEPRRYSVNGESLHTSKPEIAALLLTGAAYEPTEDPCMSELVEPLPGGDV